MLVANSFFFLFSCKSFMVLLIPQLGREGSRVGKELPQRPRRLWSLRLLPGPACEGWSGDHSSPGLRSSPGRHWAAICVARSPGLAQVLHSTGLPPVRPPPPRHLGQLPAPWERAGVSSRYLPPAMESGVYVQRKQV